MGKMTTSEIAAYAEVQVGTYWFVGDQITTNRALLWLGNAESRIDLHPQGYAGSEPRALDAIQQVGIVTPLRQGTGALLPRAALWEGAASSFTYVFKEWTSSYLLPTNRTTTPLLDLNP